MTTYNSIIRFCVALIIVLSVMLAGGAPSAPGHANIAESYVMCSATLQSNSSDNDVEIC